MASTAVARRQAEAPPGQTQRTSLKAARPAGQARHRPASQGRLARALIIFVVCLAVLAAGRVAMSFAVVQKTVATDAVAREENRLVAENAQLKEELTELGSIVRIRDVAEKRLGLVEAEHFEHLTISQERSVKAAARP